MIQRTGKAISRAGSSSGKPGRSWSRGKSPWPAPAAAHPDTPAAPQSPGSPARLWTGASATNEDDDDAMGMWREEGTGAQGAKESSRTAEMGSSWRRAASKGTPRCGASARPTEMGTPQWGPEAGGAVDTTGSRRTARSSTAATVQETSHVPQGREGEGANGDPRTTGSGPCPLAGSPGQRGDRGVSASAAPWDCRRVPRRSSPRSRDVAGPLD